uniref:Uncharacterized protein n=1 Tax=Chlamydomonas leiostraca TaxID=1034604 RepID=A0A7S0S6A3_9CHLO|mmetsp:Transcript_9916/g.24804  ORF Transcript_9916/g.24804 Transcript_9916/m.24804 type:complete len:210 (+) Transcript_9916:94-723(+)
MQATICSRIQSTALAGPRQVCHAPLARRCMVVRAGPKGSPRTESEEVTQDDATTLRSMVSSQFQYQVRRPKPTGNPVTDFMTKVQLAWKIFFPEAPKELSPKEEVKRRLRMVLVADRCGMSPASLSEMKKTIVKALQDFVDIEGEEGIEVSISNEPGLGTVYSVNIPVRRVKAETRFEPETIQTPDGVTLEWDPTDINSDPSSRFPMGC